MNELKPCPFCGGEASYEYSYDDYNHDCIVCHNDECGASLTCWPYEGEKVTAAWNRRAKPDAAPVVRCKECEHYNATGFPALNPGTGWCDKMDRGTHDDFYCSCGERKEIGGNINS